MADSMPYMTQEMATKLPEMLMATLNLVKNESAEVEK